MLPLPIPWHRTLRSYEEGPKESSKKQPANISGKHAPILFESLNTLKRGSRMPQA